RQMLERLGGIPPHAFALRVAPREFEPRVGMGLLGGIAIETHRLTDVARDAYGVLVAGREGVLRVGIASFGGQRIMLRRFDRVARSPCAAADAYHAAAFFKSLGTPIPSS